MIGNFQRSGAVVWLGISDLAWDDEASVVWAWLEWVWALGLLTGMGQAYFSAVGMVFAAVGYISSGPHLLGFHCRAGPFQRLLENPLSSDTAVRDLYLKP